MIAYFHAIALRSLVVVLTIYWFIEGLLDISYFSRYKERSIGDPSFTSSFIQDLTIDIGIFLICLILCRILIKPIMPEPDCVQCQSRPILARYSMKLTSQILLFVSGLAFTFLTAFYSTCAISHFIRPAACIADSLGCYETAERIFALDRCHPKGQCFSTLQTKLHIESPAELKGHNLAIANVYGKNSLEMAKRYNFIGYGLYLRDTNKFPSKKEAIFWLNKSISIYRNYNYTDGKLMTLCELSFIGSEYFDLNITKSIITEALRVYPKNLTDADRCALSWFKHKAERAAPETLASFPDFSTPKPTTHKTNSDRNWYQLFKYSVVFLTTFCVIRYIVAERQFKLKPGFQTC